VGGRIGVVIGLHLDDPATDTVKEEHRSNQVGRDLVHASPEKGAG
jgi:hypothetical protein